jgi:hypothetical protein
LQELHSKTRKLFQQQIGFSLLEETRKQQRLQQVIFMVLKHAHFRKRIKKTGEILNCSNEGGRRSSVFSVVWEMKQYYM